MKSSTTLLDELRRKMAGYVGKVFTEQMRQQIRYDASQLILNARDEGQSLLAPYVCGNSNTSFCPQCEGDEDGTRLEDYDPDTCRECHANGGFTI
jgi:hypothetical protein